MAGGSFSSTTSITSHTLSGDAPHAPPLDMHPSSQSALVSTLSASPHTFLQPSASLHAAALVLAKRYLDPLAVTVSEAQSQRQNEARRKRKRGENGHAVNGQVLQLNKLYLDGFTTQQVWEQARRVIDAATDEAERRLPEVLENGDNNKAPSERGSKGDKVFRMMQFNEDGFEVSSDESLSNEGVEYHTDEDEPSGSEDLGNDGVENGNDSEFNDEDIEGFESGGSKGSDYDSEEAEEEFIEDPHGLNDGFFSIDHFNKQTEFLERQDAIADPAAESGEEEIDWDVDPNSLPRTTLVRDVRSHEEGEESEDENDGPTFGNADLSKPFGDSDDDMDDEEGHIGGANGLDNTNDVKYKDFFAPPARKAAKGGRSNRKGKSGETNVNEDINEERAMQRTIDAVRRDLFEDDALGNESGDGSDLETLDPSDPRSRRSAHERRQARLAEEIRKLEAESVAKRQWTLSGEARANDRPVNSLLEEDLDFERTGKPVPVITAEVSESIEELIKRRIIAQEFDETIRRRPDALPTITRRGHFELDDSKPQQSLAEIYEEEHLRKADPENYKNKNDEKLRKDHEEIAQLWADISGKLDSLSSWHYKPKPAQPSINVIADVPTISMEEAQPTAAGGSAGDLGGFSMLAPQEVYTPGKDTVGKDEITTKSLAPVAKDELTREQKLRRRRREKERLKKQLLTGGKKDEKVESAKTKAKKGVVSDLKRGGVKVIGRKGEVRDIEGKKIKEAQGPNGAGGLKL